MRVKLAAAAVLLRGIGPQRPSTDMVALHGHDLTVPMKQEKSDAHLLAQNSFRGGEGMSTGAAFDAEANGHLHREALDEMGTQHSSISSAQRGPETVTCSSTSSSLRNPPRVDSLQKFEGDPEDGLDGLSGGWACAVGTRSSMQRGRDAMPTM